jgi:hypothetical protein
MCWRSSPYLPIKETCFLEQVRERERECVKSREKERAAMAAATTTVCVSWELSRVDVILLLHVFIVSFL